MLGAMKNTKEGKAVVGETVPLWVRWVGSLYAAGVEAQEMEDKPHESLEGECSGQRAQQVERFSRWRRPGTLRTSRKAHMAAVGQARGHAVWVPAGPWEARGFQQGGDGI